MGPFTGESKPAFKSLSRVLSSSSAHLPLTSTPSIDSVRSGKYDAPQEPDLSYPSLLYSANEMFKNLFDMATDSFGLKVGNYGPTDRMNGQAIPHYGPPVLSIYHSGALTAVMDLLPAICEVGEDGQMISNTEVGSHAENYANSSGNDLVMVTVAMTIMMGMTMIVMMMKMMVP